jgi:hypothetical protein
MSNGLQAQYGTYSFIGFYDDEDLYRGLLLVGLCVGATLT